MIAWPAASTPWTWKTDLAMSRPIVVTVCMDSSSESWEPQQRPHPWHSRAGWRSRPQHHKRTSRHSLRCRLLQHRAGGQDDPEVVGGENQPVTPCGNAGNGWLPVERVMPTAFNDEKNITIATPINSTDRIGSAAHQTGISSP